MNIEGGEKVFIDFIYFLIILRMIYLIEGSLFS